MPIAIGAAQPVDASVTTTIYLPPAARWTGLSQTYSKSDSSATTVTITPDGSETIGGAASYVLSLQGDSVTIYSDGSATIQILEQVYAPSSPGYARWVEVALTSAELLALRATPKTLVAAPGAGKVLEFLDIMLLLDYGTAAYAENAGGSNLGVRYTNGSGVQVSEDIEMTGYITQTADYVTFSQAKKDAIVAASAAANKALVLHNIGAGELVTGDSVMRVKVAYRIWSTGF